MIDLKERIRTVPDFPKKGIRFIDITTLVGDGAILKEVTNRMSAQFDGEKIDVVMGIESRGFIFASILAHRWGVGLVLVRKPGKLPYKTIRETYDLEYGEDALEIHIDALKPGQKVLIVDDLLATGGTVQASAKLAERLGAEVVGCCFVVELDFLHGRRRLINYRVESLVHYAEE
jgi:adenine phosphoribosyltransferase